MTDESDQALEYQEAMQAQLRKSPERVPFYLRADISSHELDQLRGRLSQAEGERDAYEVVIRTLLRGLGFDDSWAISLTGAREAIATLLDIAAGKYTRKECQGGELAADTVIAVIFDLRTIIDILELAGFRPYYEENRLVGFSHHLAGVIYKPFGPDLEAYYNRDDGLG